MSKKPDIFTYVKGKNTDLSDEQITDGIGSFFSAIHDNLSAGKRLEIRGFGSFSVKLRPARTGRNPRTGEAIEIAEKNVIGFKIGSDLKKSVNKKAA